MVFLIPDLQSFPPDPEHLVTSCKLGNFWMKSLRLRAAKAVCEEHNVQRGKSWTRLYKRPQDVSEGLVLETNTTKP